MNIKNTQLQVANKYLIIIFLLLSNFLRKKCDFLCENIISQIYKCSVKVYKVIILFAITYSIFSYKLNILYLMEITGRLLKK